MTNRADLPYLSVNSSGTTTPSSVSGNAQVGIRVHLNSFGTVFGPSATPVSIAANGSFGIQCSESLFNVFVASPPYSLSGNNGGGAQTSPDPLSRTCP